VSTSAGALAHTGLLFVNVRSDFTRAQSNLQTGRVSRMDTPHQREHIEERRLGIVRVIPVNPFHRGGIRPIARGLVALAVQDLHRMQIGPLPLGELRGDLDLLEYLSRG
jgi:hypothetical protein